MHVKKGNMTYENRGDLFAILGRMDAICANSKDYTSKELVEFIELARKTLEGALTDERTANKV